MCRRLLAYERGQLPWCRCRLRTVRRVRSEGGMAHVGPGVRRRARSCTGMSSLEWHGQTAVCVDVRVCCRARSVWKMIYWYMKAVTRLANLCPSVPFVFVSLRCVCNSLHTVGHSNSVFQLAYSQPPCKCSVSGRWEVGRQWGGSRDTRGDCGKWRGSGGAVPRCKDSSSV